MFFEASISGDSYTSFVTNGFIDEEGYVEPQIIQRNTKTLKTVVVISSIAIVLLIYFITKYVRRQKQIKYENEKLAEHRMRKELQAKARRSVDQSPTKRKEAIK